MKVKIIMISEYVDESGQRSLGRGRSNFFILYKSLILCGLYLNKSFIYSSKQAL